MKRPVERKGTLILATLCQNGVLICADQGLVASDKAGTYTLVSNSERKIFRLTENVVFTACGSIRFAESDNSTELFNAIEIVRDYFAKQEFDNTDRFWKHLEDEVIGSFNQNLIVGKDIDDWPLEEADEDKILMRLIFFFMDEARRVFLAELHFRYVRQIPVEVSIKSEKSWFRGLIYANGHTTLLRKISDGDKALQDIASHPLVRMFLSGRTEPKTIRLQHAKDFCEIIMKASKERLADTWVSSEFNCELLNGHIRFVPLEKVPIVKNTKLSNRKKRRR